MADAIIRTLWRRFVSQANLLEWETMAQSESSGGARFALFEKYLYFSSLVWLPFMLSGRPDTGARSADLRAFGSWRR